MYVLLNAPIEALGPASQTFAFGEVESQVEAFAPNVEDERAGDGDGDRDGNIGGMDGTTSGGGIHSKRVEAALLAAKSQHVCYS